MQNKLELIPGLPKRELVERLHYHQRQGEISDRAVGFYLHDMDKRKMYEPYENAAEWARNHLPQPQRERPDKLILLARRLEKLPLIEAAFNSGEVPWTKIREIARIADAESELFRARNNSLMPRAGLCRVGVNRTPLLGADLSFAFGGRVGIIRDLPRRPARGLRAGSGQGEAHAPWCEQGHAL